MCDGRRFYVVVALRKEAEYMSDYRRNQWLIGPYEEGILRKANEFKELADKLEKDETLMSDPVVQDFLARLLFFLATRCVLVEPPAEGLDCCLLEIGEGSVCQLLLKVLIEVAYALIDVAFVLFDGLYLFGDLDLHHFYVLQNIWVQKR